MYSKQKQRLGFNCTVFLLTACASCISVSAYGSGKTFAKPSRAAPAKSSESYNIQPAGSALGTLGDDDCEDDYATQVMSRNQFNAPASTTSAAVAPAAKNESLGSQVQAQPKTPPSMESVALAALAKESKAPIESKESQTAKPVPTSSASRASINCPLR
jgi:hypothetical protein